VQEVLPRLSHLFESPFPLLTGQPQLTWEDLSATRAYREISQRNSFCRKWCKSRYSGHRQWEPQRYCGSWLTC